MADQKKDKYLGIRMTPEEHAEFQKAAASHGWSMSWVLRRLIQIFVRNHKELPPEEFHKLLLPEETPDKDK